MPSHSQANSDDTGGGSRPPVPTDLRHGWIWPVALVLVTLLALGVRWYYVSTAMVINPIRADAAQYYAHAWNLVHHGVFSGSHPGAQQVIADNYRDPGYPLLLAAWMKVFASQDSWYAAVLLTQALLGALTVPLAMQLGRRWLDWRWATAAGVLMAVWPHNIAIASDLLSETLFGFLCALAMLLVARACDHRSTAWAIAAGVAFSAAALTNAVLLPFGVLLAAFLGWRRLAARRVWLALLIASLVLPGAWAIRNQQLPPQPGMQTSTDRALQNLVQGSWPGFQPAYALLANGDMRGKPLYQAVNAQYALLRDSPRAGAREIMQRLAAHPLRYLAWYALEKPWILWDWDIRFGQNDIYVYATAHSPFDTQAAMRALEAICHTLNPALALLALACLVVTLASRWRRKCSDPPVSAALAATLFLLAYITVLYSVLQTDPRYAIPFRSFEFLLAMTSCSALAESVSRLRRQPQQAPPAPSTPQ